MLVYRAHRASAVHFDPECPKMPATAAPQQLALLKAVTSFCKTCTPERLHERPRTRHVACTVCGHSRPLPCAHNGGIPVINVDEMTHYGREVRRVNTRWRWPENVTGSCLAPVAGSD